MDKEIKSVKKLDWSQKLFKNFAACIKQVSSVVE